jgi:hypothetical protein
MPFSVIPAETGIQLFQDVLDPGVRQGDGFGDLFAKPSVLSVK